MLDFIHSSKKRSNIERILNSYHPSHSERVYLVCFLNRCCGLNKRDIDSIINHHSNWGDLDPIEVDRQTASLCREPKVFCEDLSFVNKIDENPQYRKCLDNGIFGKLNKNFFEGAYRSAWEYEPQKYNIYGRMSWDTLSHPVYRSIEDKNGLMFYIDLDCTDLVYGWEVAKRLYEIDTWTTFKYSGSRGFHLCKLIKTNNYTDLKELGKELYKCVKTNLISYGTETNNNKLVNIDTSSFNRSRLVRGFCRNYKGGYSYPVHSEMNITDIIETSKDLDKIKEILK